MWRQVGTCMRAGMSFQVESIVESFAAEGTEIALDIRMALHVPVEESLQGETFGAQAAGELERVVRIGRHFGLLRRVGFGTVAGRVLFAAADPFVNNQGILDTVATIDEL